MVTQYTEHTWMSIEELIAVAEATDKPTSLEIELLARLVDVIQELEGYYNAEDEITVALSCMGGNA